MAQLTDRQRQLQERSALLLAEMVDEDDPWEREITEVTVVVNQPPTKAESTLVKHKLTALIVAVSTGAVLGILEWLRRSLEK